MNTAAEANIRHDAALLLLRLSGGGFLLPHGLGKLFGWFGGPGLDGFVQELTQFGLPSGPAIALVLAAVQTLSGLGVLLGAGTRISALVAAGFIATTVWIALPNGWFWMGTGVEYPLMWLAVLLAIAGLGGGAFAVDHLRAQRKGAQA